MVDKTQPDSAPPGSLADPGMLGKIDRLFACNVGHYIDLPQLVVIGDQSSGKSSVLEGLTNLPFPRDSGLCTRFATQITFRRSQTTQISINIIPGKSSSPEHTEHVRGWSKTDLFNLGGETFSDIMREVHTVMGLSEETENTISPTFSDDVLSLEVCGPDQEHLSIIDVPGIFKKKTQGVTSKADIQMVRSMVLGYMENSRSVMLAVIPASVDIATQEILEMAEEVDPDGQRTLGILTKPDLVDKGAESAVIDLIEGRRHQLALGWHIVRNPGQQDLSDSAIDRHALEETFFWCTPPWSSLNKERVGIPALQVRLREVLAVHIRHEFPKVKLELNKKLERCKTLLMELGATRDTPADQLKYLIDISTRFQETVTAALNSQYCGNDILDQTSKIGLVTAVVNRSEAFSKSVQIWGNTYRFNDYNGDGVGVQPVVPLPAPVFNTRESRSHVDIRDLLQENEMLPEPHPSGILEWLTMVYQNSRGFELGTFNPSLLALTMKEQSKKWDSIAHGYIGDVVTMTHTFVVDLLHSICPDERVRAGLAFILMDGLVERYKKACAHVGFILQVERSGTPMTLNHYFNDNLEKSRQGRMQKEMSALSLDSSTSSLPFALRSPIVPKHLSNSKYTIQDLHDILHSYYKVARKRIVDVICMQAADHFLISGPDTPLKLFSPVFVGTMTPEQLEDVAGEDVRQKRRRKQLQKEIEDLEIGKKILT